MKTARFLSPLLFVLIITLSCEKKTELKTPVKQFDLNLFEQNIKDAMDNNTIGYAYSISHNGTQVRTGSWGNAVADFDAVNDGPKPHGVSRRQDIASVSKVITALACLNLMEQEGVKEGSIIGTYLPYHWTYNSNLDTRNFLNIMSHQAGIPSTGGIFHSSIKALAEADTTYTTGPFNYSNSNYAILRIVIAYMWDKPTLRAIESDIVTGGKTENDLADAISQQYNEAVNHYVFDPIGIPYTEPKPVSGKDKVWNYNFALSSGGWVIGDATAFVGSAGWRLSANELNNIIANARYNNNYLSATQRNLMESYLMGWDPGASMNVEGGMSYGHGGFHNEDFWTTGISLGRGCLTAVIQFPNNYEVAAVTNAIGGMTNNMETTLINAYNNAWVIK